MFINRLDLGMLLGAKGNESASSVTRQTEELAKQTADFISQFQKTSETMSQYQKQATESIKNAVGVSGTFVKMQSDQNAISSLYRDQLVKAAMSV